MLVLRFIVDDGKTSQLVISPAKISDLTGLYNDARFIYTEAGKYERRFIKGLEEEFLPDEEAL